MFIHVKYNLKIYIRTKETLPRRRTMSKDHGGEGVPKTSTELIQRTSTKLFIDSMFKNPNNKCHKHKEECSDEPQIPCKRL